MPRRSLDRYTQSLWTPHNRENGESDQYRVQGAMPRISKSSSKGIQFLEGLCRYFHWCRNRTRWFCLACGFDMMGYAWLCRYDSEGNPKRCFEAFHNKKNATWVPFSWVYSFRIRERYISSSCKQHQFFPSQKVHVDILLQHCILLPIHRNTTLNASSKSWMQSDMYLAFTIWNSETCMHIYWV